MNKNHDRDLNGTSIFISLILRCKPEVNSKMQYSFNKDKTLIWANQGHFIPVNVDPPIVRPLEYLYHGNGWNRAKVCGIYQKMT